MGRRKQLNWFKRRIGKRIFRNATSCQCSVCQSVVKDGLYVIDERHAQYLLDWEGQDNGLGGVIKYDDNWIEVNDTLPDDVQEAYQNHVKKKEYELAQEDLLYALKLLKKEDEYKKLRNGNW